MGLLSIFKRYDENGFDRNGIHRNGTRYDANGYDYEGYDKNGNSKFWIDKEEYDNSNMNMNTLIDIKLNDGISRVYLRDLYDPQKYKCEQDFYNIIEMWIKTKNAKIIEVNNIETNNKDKIVQNKDEIFMKYIKTLSRSKIELLIKSYLPKNSTYGFGSEGVKELVFAVCLAEKFESLKPEIVNSIKQVASGEMSALQFSDYMDKVILRSPISEMCWHEGFRYFNDNHKWLENTTAAMRSNSIRNFNDNVQNGDDKKNTNNYNESTCGQESLKLINDAINYAKSPLLENMSIHSDNLKIILDRKKQRVNENMNKYSDSLIENVIFYSNTIPNVKYQFKKFLEEEVVLSEPELDKLIQNVQEYYRLPNYVYDERDIKGKITYNNIPITERIKRLEFDYMYYNTYAEILYEALGFLTNARNKHILLKVNTDEMMDCIDKKVTLNTNFILDNIC